MFRSQQPTDRPVWAWMTSVPALLALSAFAAAQTTGGGGTNPVPRPSPKPSASRAAEENVSFGRIYGIQDMRLDVRDEVTGEIAKYTLSPDTVVEIGGATRAVRDLEKDARIRVIPDTSDPTKVTRVVVVQEEPARLTPGNATVVEPGDVPAKVEINPVPPVPMGWELKTGENGVVVTRIVDNSPASAAKLRVGDVLKRVGEKNVLTPEGVDAALHLYPPQAQAPVQLMRGADALATAIVLPPGHQQRPAPPNDVFTATDPLAGAKGTPAVTSGQMGVQIASLNLGWGLVQANDAVQIVRVDPDTPAFGAQLAPGDFLTHIDNQPVAAPAAVYYHLNLHRPGDNVQLTANRGGQPFTTYLVMPPTDPGLISVTRLTPQEGMAVLFARVAEQQAQIDLLQTQILTLSQQVQQLTGQPTVGR